MEQTGIIIQQVTYSVKETIDRATELLNNLGSTIYARIDQQAELSKAGIQINALEFLLFGNPAKGGVLMKANPVTALDLPLKLIAWEDEQKQVWIAYNEAGYLQHRFALTNEQAALANITLLITNILSNKSH